MTRREYRLFAKYYNDIKLAMAQVLIKDGRNRRSFLSKGKVPAIYDFYDGTESQITNQILRSSKVSLKIALQRKAFKEKPHIKRIVRLLIKSKNIKYVYQYSQFMPFLLSEMCTKIVKDKKNEESNNDQKRVDSEKLQ